MPTFTVRKDNVFHYTDSGPVEHDEYYSTFIFVHGLSFHTATFQKILPVASSHSLRVICLSRREYQGSSPYTAEELKTITDGSEEECASFLQEQGVLLALFVDGIIRTLSLPKAGGVAIVGWSLGNIFTLAFRACIGVLPADTQERLKSYMRGFIIWDPPVQALGFTLHAWPTPPLPSPEEFYTKFLKVASSYFNHADMNSKDSLKLDEMGDPSRKPTCETMTPEELSSVLDFAPSFKCDIPLLLPRFTLSFSNQAKNALLNSQVRDGWGGSPVSHLCGDHSPPVVVTSLWQLKEKVKSEAPHANINFKVIKDANHFLMWEEPDRFLVVMKECVSVKGYVGKSSSTCC